eukprot:COSAG02_NODE_41916_length_389_cov_1.275862_1_plen_124_part_10
MVTISSRWIALCAHSCTSVQAKSKSSHLQDAVLQKDSRSVADRWAAVQGSYGSGNVEILSCASAGRNDVAFSTIAGAETTACAKSTYTAGDQALDYCSAKDQTACTATTADATLTDASGAPIVP